MGRIGDIFTTDIAGLAELAEDVPMSWARPDKAAGRTFDQSVKKPKGNSIRRRMAEDRFGSGSGLNS
jgi:hypothetical protein